jgi:hypothetical protein
VTLSGGRSAGIQRGDAARIVLACPVDCEAHLLEPPSCACGASAPGRSAGARGGGFERHLQLTMFHVHVGCSLTRSVGHRLSNLEKRGAEA